MRPRLFLDKVTRRQRWITGAVATALAVTLAAIALGYWWSRAHKGRSMPAPQTLPSDVHQQLLGYTFTRSEEGRQLFTVHAARTVALKEGGVTVLEDVFVEVFGRTGKRRDLLRTRRCDYHPQSGDLFSSGTVEIELNAQSPIRPASGLRGRPPVLLETSRVSFRHRGSLVASDERVEFRVGSVSGSARGMAYGTREGWLELSRDVAIQLRSSGGTASEAPIELTAARLRYERAAGEVRLWGPLEVRQANRRVLADQGTVYLDESDRVRRAVLEGGVRVSESTGLRQVVGTAQRISGEFDPASHQLLRLVAEGEVSGESRRDDTVSSFTAEQLVLSFAAPQRQLRTGMASGNVRLAIQSSGASPTRGNSSAAQASLRKQSLTSGHVAFDFWPGGVSLEKARTEGPGTLVLVPSDPHLGERVITAGQFALHFNRSGRLERLRGSSPTRIVFMPGPEALPGDSPQESTAQWLEAVFDTTTQTLTDVEQVGDFRFRNGERQASAERALYVVSDQRLELLGAPRLWDDRTRIGAERIVFNLRTDAATGLGKVQSTHFEGGSEPTGAGREPTYVLADRVLADRRGQFVRYEGHVRAWHGQDVVESSSLDIYRADRRVTSGAQVLTSHLQPASRASGASAAGASPRETSAVTIRADGLEYFDAGREACYRGNVRLQTENTTLRAHRLNVFFSASKAGEIPRLERAVAEGQVKVLQPSRSATGERAEYEAAAGRIELTGGPPELVDAEKGLTRGERLTFFIHDDSLLVDGGGKSPTLSQRRVAR